MRKILFKAKRKDNGEWVEGFLFELFFEGIWCIGNNPLQPNDYSEIIGENKDWFYINPDTICQYTGLKDKNGKEIYEGDVVKKVDTNGLGWHRERNCKVSFDKEGYWLLTTEYGDGYWIGEVDIEQLEVIGNIFDNPELLERGAE